MISGRRTGRRGNSSRGGWRDGCSFGRPTVVKPGKAREAQPDLPGLVIPIMRPKLPRHRARLPLERFVVFDGNLSDMPGRCESWTEYVKPLGRRRWAWMSEGTDFTGTEPQDCESEICETTDLLVFLLQSYDESGGCEAPVGPRLRALRARANRYGLVSLVKIIDGIRDGTWPSVKNARKPRVIRVSGTGGMGSFIGGRPPYRIFLRLETAAGEAFMWVPKPGARTWYCTLGNHPYNSLNNHSWEFRLTKKLLAQTWATLAAADVTSLNEDSARDVATARCAVAQGRRKRARGGVCESPQAGPSPNGPRGTRPWARRDGE